MWFGTNSGGAGKFNGNKFTTISDNEGLINNAVYSIIENDKNEIVFGTSKGISVFNGFKFKNYNEKQGLTNSWIFKLLQDGDKSRYLDPNWNKLLLLIVSIDKKFL